jgi:hypothetical protein
VTATDRPPARTITATLTDGQYYALQEAAEEAANDSPASAAMAVLDAAWERGQRTAVTFAADDDAPPFPDDLPGLTARALGFPAPAPPRRTPKVEIRLATEISGEWVTPEMVARAARELASSMASGLRAAADEAPAAEGDM